MGKKTKLRLQDLKVISFVTTDAQKRKILGGAKFSFHCPTGSELETLCVTDETCNTEGAGCGNEETDGHVC